MPAPSTMAPAIEFRELTVASPQGKRLLGPVSLAVEEGSITAILGRSGSGKTTLLRTVNRLIDPDSGVVSVRGGDVRGMDLIELRRGIGYVIQETGLFPHFTVERNVGAVLEAMSRPFAERKTRSDTLLASVGLDPALYAQRYPHQLSGGQRQRVGLARALAADPSILLMDEPFGALDPLTRTEMQEMLRDLLQRLRKTVVLVTHDLDEALYLAHRIVLLAEGRLVANLAPHEFLASNEQDVAAYLRPYRLRAAAMGRGNAHE
ncbi:MAG TPA: ATP-binding cassette domain-containing protein [Terracidiphilus sp.]|nr:ATP-binding cassette domain-containing protein [Terracidiphilus sp.]